MSPGRRRAAGGANGASPAHATDALSHPSALHRRVSDTEGGIGDRVEVAAGETVVVPAGVGHTVDLIEPGGTLDTTHGAGTGHRPR